MLPTTSYTQHTSAINKYIFFHIHFLCVKYEYSNKVHQIVYVLITDYFTGYALYFISSKIQCLKIKSDSSIIYRKNITTSKYAHRK